jgi:hypothetical protein
MAEEVTKVVENIDKLFSEIVVNGESHVSDRYVPPEPAQANPVSTNQEEEEQTPSTPQRDMQGGYVDTLCLNNTLHDLKDSPLTQEVLTIQQTINTLQGRLNDLVTSVGNINSKIPVQASAQNQLADKNFVNSSISTNTANFLGTYSTLAEIEAIPNPTNNDYAFLETADSSGNNVYDRYKYSADDEEWLFEYELNNSSFTAEQWATINSGITQVSDTVQDGDNNPVSSDAVYEALQNTISMQAVFDTSHPVGETYTQYPEQLDPVSLYNQNGIQSTWTLLDFGGAFFRAEGGNALAFNNSKEVTAVSGAVLTIPSSGASVGCLVYDPVGNETRTVTAVSGNNVTVDSAFTSTDLTNVLIGQSQGTAKNGLSASFSGKAGTVSVSGGNHRHQFGSSSTSGNVYTANLLHGSGDVYTGYSGKLSMSGSFTPSGSVSLSSTDTETRPVNYTIKVWKRTA